MEQIKKYVLKLLSYRPYTCFEIKQKLKQKNFSEEEIEETVAFLKEKQLLDDRRWAREWLQERVRNKPRGKSLLKEELRKRGIPPQIIEEEIKKIFKEVKEIDLASQLLEKKFLSKKLEKIEKEKIKSQIYSFLTRRGFSDEIIEKILYKFFS
jgi:regulatory protein